MNLKPDIDHQGQLTFEIVDKDGRVIEVVCDNPQVLFEKLWEFGFRYPKIDEWNKP